MARVSGSLGISSNFEPQIAAPFDARAIVPTKADLTVASNWTALDGGSYIYEGMTVTVAEDSTASNNGIYVLTDASDVTDINNWLFIGSGGGSTPNLDEVTDVGNTTTNEITVSVLNATSGDFSGAVTASTVGVNADNFNGAFEVDGISYQSGRVLFPKLDQKTADLKFLAIQTGSLGGFGELTPLDFSHFVSSSDTGSFLYSGSYESSTNLITLYSKDENYDLDLSGLAGGGGLAITASYTGSVLTENARSFNFEGNAVDATHVGNAVTVAINTSSVENIYSTDGTLTSDRTVQFGDSDLTFDAPSNIFTIASNASTGRVFITELPTTDNPQVIGVNSSGQLAYMNTSSIGGGGSTTPGGPLNTFQFNNSNAFSGSSLFFDSVNERVGIGESSPDRPLHITDTNGVAVRLERTDDANVGIQFYDSSSTVNGSIIRGQGNNFELIQSIGSGASNQKRNLYISSSGEVYTPRISNSDQQHLVTYDTASGEITYITASEYNKNIYNSDGSIPGNRTITMDNGGGNFIITGSAANGGQFGTFQVYTNEVLFPLITDAGGTSVDIVGIAPNGRLFSTSSDGFINSSVSSSTNDTEVLFNDNDSIAGDAQFTWNKTGNYLTLIGNANSPSLRLSSSLAAQIAGQGLGELVVHSSVTDTEVGGIAIKSDGAFSDGDVPTRMEFSTTPDGTETPTVKLQIKEDGQLIADEYGSGTFTGTAAKYLAVDSSGDIIEEDAPSTDYVSGVTISGDDLSFTGVGSAFNSTVDLSSIAGGSGSVRASINPPDDVVYEVDGNLPNNEFIIGDTTTPSGYSNIDEINGRTILITQDNTNNGTLRFGFASWTGNLASSTSKRTFECTGYNIGQEDFNAGVYLPEGTWDMYQIGHQAGGGDRVAEYQTNISIGSGGAPRYFTRAMIEGSKFEVYYNYFEKQVLIWCSAWTGTGGATGAVTFSAANPNP